MIQFFTLSSLFVLTCAFYQTRHSSLIEKCNPFSTITNNIADRLPAPGSTLPVTLTNFQGSLNDKKISLQWGTAQNETAEQFEIQRSFDGANFKTVAVMFASEKIGIENYTYNEFLNGSEVVYYRLKLHDKEKKINYSKILAFQACNNQPKQLKLLNNPATDRLAFSFLSETNSLWEVKIYDMNGKLQLKQTVNVAQGNNSASISITSLEKTAMYVLELNNGIERQTVRFVKQ